MEYTNTDYVCIELTDGTELKEENGVDALSFEHGGVCTVMKGNDGAEEFQVREFHPYHTIKSVLYHLTNKYE